MPETLLEGQNLEFEFPERRLFRGLNLTLDRGEVLGVLGPSGCGKSTLLRILMGLLEPSRGKVQSAARKSNAVFQEPRLLPWRDIRSNILLPLEIRGGKKSDSELQNLIARVRLTASDLTRFPHELSGGMKMRVALARSLVTEPEVLFLDEPFAALDETTRFNLQDLLVELLTGGLAAVFVTHSIQEAVYLADRVLILNREGSIKDEWRRPAVLMRTPALRESLNFFEEAKSVGERFRRAQL